MVSSKVGEKFIKKGPRLERRYKRADIRFLFDIELDDERRIQSVFWADAVMISDYAKFADFVSFDTTYRTNDMARPLGIFVCFNHHKCMTILGAELMHEKTGKPFKWLFESFLKSMNHKFPKTLMTDQAPTITLAIRDVFPGVFHALCSWHINQNAKKHLGSKAKSQFQTC
ncbi:hypothetical protein LIER_37916 [Lithospermum erythrorhizon]|uniref:MULE transposase domain-containing protein n=1 Tax=Lithospermum erythrorhizon TaxID=34254 RepID=A0AAV3PTK0_LITER